MDRNTGNLGKPILTEQKGKGEGMIEYKGKMKEIILESKETQNV